MVKYGNNSPWFRTKQYTGYLGNLTIRPVPAEPDDYLYTIETQYNYRPDLLAHDIYGSAKLWWVFSQRNMDVIEDPVFDFRAGVSIFIPKKSSLVSMLRG